MMDLENEKQNIKVSAGFDGDPVKLLKGRGNVFNIGSSGDDRSGCVLD